MKKFGTIIKEARLEKRATLDVTSSTVGLALSSLSEIENGHRAPPSKKSVLKKLSVFLNLEYESLYTQAMLERDVYTGAINKRMFSLSHNLTHGIMTTLNTMNDDELLLYMMKIQSLLSNRQ